MHINPLSMPSNYIKDQSLSNEVEQWLKKNKPTVLKAGESLGEIDYSTVGSGKTAAQNKATLEEREAEKKKAIAERTEQKEKQKEERRAQALKEKQQRELKSKKLKEEQLGFFSNWFADTGRTLLQLAKAADVSKHTIERVVYNDKAMTVESFNKIKQVVNEFDFSVFDKKPVVKKVDPSAVLRRAEYERRMTVKRVAEDAKAYGVSTFTAPCKDHGETEYKLLPNGSFRCKRCYPNKADTFTFPKLSVRDDYNRSEMLKAVEQGLNRFTGSCAKHGDSKFAVFKSQRTKAGYSCLCTQCRVGFDSVRTPKPKKEKPKPTPKVRATKLHVFTVKQMATKHNVEAKAQAVAQGLNRFKGICVKHGYSEYRISKKAHNCMSCKVATKNAHRQRLLEISDKYTNMVYNREQHKIAVENGVTRFIGKCVKHGDTDYLIYGKAHQCRLCNLGQKKNRSAIDDTKRNNLKLNRELMQATLDFDINLRKFTGVCMKHGEGVFYIKKNKTSFGFCCRTCTNSKTKL